MSTYGPPKTGGAVPVEFAVLSHQEQVWQRQTVLVRCAMFAQIHLATML